MNTAREYFGRVAERWDEIRPGYFGEEVREAAIERAYLRPEMVVADVGAGTGFMAQGLAPLVVKVYALDASPEMLAVARRKLADFDNVEFRVAAGCDLPLEDESLDAVFANMYLHHAPDPLAAIVEMVRILKPGGRLVITDSDKHDHEWMREEMADLWLGFERDQIHAWYEEAGLVNVVVDCTGQNCCASSKEGQGAEVSIFVATGTKPVLAVKEKVREGYRARAKEERVSSPCCNASYSAAELADIPADALGMSMGCGNPVALANLQAGEVVLDIGSGAGIDVFYAARKVGPEGRVIGLDMLEDMVQRARRTAVQEGYHNVEFRPGGAEQIPLADASVDVIISNCVINLALDKGRVFREAYRVLKDSGHLCISDIVTDAPLPESIRSDPDQWARCVAGALTEREYVDLITQAGFKAIQTTAGQVYDSPQGVKVYSLYITAYKSDVPQSSPTGAEMSAGQTSAGCCESVIKMACC